MSVIAGVDSSTQSTKVVLRDADTGRVLGSGSAPHPRTSPPRSEQDPAAWWDALRTAMAAALTAAHVDGGAVQAISVAAQCHGLVALDGHDEVIRPAKLWNDTTSAPEMAFLRRQLPDADWAERTGSVPTAAFTVSKLLWLVRHEPRSYARLSKVMLPHDWLTWRLTGEHVTDRSEASGTGYFDPATDRWDTGILGLVDADRDWTPALPTVRGPQEAAGVLTALAADALGLRAGIVVGPGAGDQHASALGLGVAPGDTVWSFGTSGVVFTSTPDRVVDPTGFVDGVADAAGGYLPLVCTLNAARVTDSFARLLGVDHEELSRLALAAESAGIPVLSAYLDGERKPDLPAATGTLAGLTTDTSRAQVARAAVEGVVFGLLRGHRALRALGLQLDGSVLATGGGARSRAYTQVLANAVGRPVRSPGPVEAVALGAAVQAAACRSGASLAEVTTDWAPATTTVAEPVPDPTLDGRYDRYVRATDWRGGDRV